jgi:hypothetical protein
MEEGTTLGGAFFTWMFGCLVQAVCWRGSGLEAPRLIGSRGRFSDSLLVSHISQTSGVPTRSWFHSVSVTDTTIGLFQSHESFAHQPNAELRQGM